MATVFWIAQNDVSRHLAPQFTSSSHTIRYPSIRVFWFSKSGWILNIAYLDSQSIIQCYFGSHMLETNSIRYLFELGEKAEMNKHV